MKRTLQHMTATLAAILAAASLVASVGNAQPVMTPYVKSSLVQVDVYDRVDGSALTIYDRNGRHYIVGVPGHEYAVRIRNCTGARVLVVTSVDGVNVISGDTAAPDQSGYVLEPWASVEIAGWRKSLARTAAFYFTDLGDSYAARTGRPQNVGVIGVAVFQERQKRIARREYDYREPLPQKKSQADAGAMNERAEAQAVPPAGPAASADAPRQNTDELASMGKLGTGHGRSEESRVSVVQFERASSSPAEVVSIQYDRRDNLLAMGIIPQPTPHIARREPNPFPGMRFVPNP